MRKRFAGAAVPTEITGAIDADDLAFTLDDDTGWGDFSGAGDPFVVTLDRGEVTEEKVLCDSLNTTTNVVTVNASGRGYDGTAAAAHSAGATAHHTIDSVLVDEANEMANADLDGAFIATQESTASDTYVDLTTAGPAGTIDVPASGRVQVTLGGSLHNATSGGWAIMVVALSGANTVAAPAGGISLALKSMGANSNMSASRTFMLEGLTPGSTTFTAKYARASAGSAVFSAREVLVEAKP